MTSISDFSADDLAGNQRSLSEYEGKVILVVNTASKCGFTPQFEGLEKLYNDFNDQGFVVLGFPCNQFAAQEPSSGEDIQSFCSLNYGVSFPMFEKIDVNGKSAHPLYEWLKTAKGGVLSNTIKWNFTKFLVGRDGQVIKRYSPVTKPEAIADDIRTALSAPRPQ